MPYKAFLSYSHADEAWAAWIHKALETYRVPRRLVGQTGSHGQVPSRLAPIFRDREELSSGADLSEHIKEALKESESLIVVCSPASAQSRWVNEEIRQFRLLGKEQRIYCVIVDGEPQSADPQLNCFPAALLENEDHYQAEPLAADVRKWADGKALAKLKLAAGLLGVRLDKLRQRELQRKRKIQAVFAGVILAITALVLSSIQSRIAEKEARQAQEEQQASAESMLAGFLEQSERLGDIADIQTRKAFMEILSSYLVDLNPADLTQESRRQLGVALMNQGVILRDEELLDDAMDAFENARDILQLLVEDTGGNAEALFELSQAEYWIGQLHFDLGKIQLAEESFLAYADVSTRLHDLRPDNAVWTMEAAYAQSNLGNLESYRTPSNPQLTLHYHEVALSLNEAAARLDRKYEAELAESHANLGDAWLGVCGLQKAMQHRMESVRLAAQHHEQNPVSNALKQDYAYALAGLSGVQLMSGQLEIASENSRRSLQLVTELRDADPNNLEKSWARVQKAARHAQFLELTGNEQESWDLSLAVKADMEKYLSKGQDRRLDRALDQAEFLRDFAYRAYRKGEIAFASQMLESSINQYIDLAASHPNSKKVPIELAKSYFYYWEHNDNLLPDDSVNTWLSRLKGTLNMQACSELDTTARISVMTNDGIEAQIDVDKLIGNGYGQPEFMRFCAEYDLCAQ